MNGILGGLVGITAGCAVVNVWESLFIGENIRDPLPLEKEGQMSCNTVIRDSGVNLN